MATLFDGPACVGASRVKAPYVRLRQLRTLYVQLAKTLQGRSVTEEERRWLALAIDDLDQLIRVGDAVVTMQDDPKITRRARKRR